jgi:hypothetical protein
MEKHPPLIKRGVGVSLVWRKKLADRLVFANLKTFLITVGWIANYEFDDADWQAVSNMLAGTNYDDDTWCEYEMVGSHSARLRLARGEQDFVYVDANVPAELLPQLRLAMQIFTTFQVSE